MNQMGRDMTVSFEVFSSIMDSIFAPSGPPAPARQTMSASSVTGPVHPNRSGFVDLMSANPAMQFQTTDGDIRVLEAQYRREADEAAGRARRQANELMGLALLGGQLRREREEKAYVTPQTIQLAEAEIRAWCSATPIPHPLVRLVLRLWRESENGQFPSLNRLVEFALDRGCLCLRQYPVADQRACLSYFLTTYGVVPSCPATAAAMEFYHLHAHAWPTQEQLDLTMRRQFELMNDPAGFAAADKLHIPTPNLAALQPEELRPEETANCALCQEAIEAKQPCFRLQPCGHVFHAESKACLGGCNIVTWLGEHRTCPICRAEVKIIPN